MIEKETIDDFIRRLREESQWATRNGGLASKADSIIYDILHKEFSNEKTFKEVRKRFDGEK